MMTKINKNLIKGLNSRSEEVVVQTIKEIQHTGNSAYIPYLLDKLDINERSEIQDALMFTLNNLKDQSCVPVLAAALYDENLHSELYRIVSACWQSGLDFSHYLKNFIDVFLFGNYHAALEAFTVIETNLEMYSVPEKDINEGISTLKSNVSEMDNHKQKLAEELIEVLESV